MLALELGYASVDRMLETMTAYELEEWIAYFNYRAEIQDRAMKQSQNRGRNPNKNATM